MPSSLFRPVALLAATLALGACSAYDRGYSRVSVGYGYGGYGYGGYASPYYGWYDGFYYPGTGYYIYDRYGSRYRWSDHHRRYWYDRRSGHRDIRDNWSGYRREARRDGRDGNREWRRDGRRDRADDRRSWSSARSEAVRSRNDSRREARKDRPNNSKERRGWRTRRDD